MAAQSVFISYRAEGLDESLAKKLHDGLKNSDHNVFMSGESIRLGEEWSERIDQELRKCTYFVLLLSAKSAASDMVAGEVRTVRELRDKCGKPVILPIRVNLTMDEPINYELRSYLSRIQQRSWKSENDTALILAEIISLLEAGADHEPVEEINPKLPLDDSKCPPMPTAELELPGGKMGLTSSYYVDREPLESRCFKHVEQHAGLIRIKAPRQMGKTSLLARILNHSEEKGYQIATFDFMSANEAKLSNLTDFLMYFCAMLSIKLGMDHHEVRKFWDEDLLGSKQCCEDYIMQYLLEKLEKPLVVGLDELDRLFPYNEVAKEFFSLLRSWNEQGKVNEIWAKLRIVIVHSTESYVVMDTNSSPFNVGMAVELPEFTPDQVFDLAKRHHLPWSDQEVGHLMAMVGGHPYLVRQALYNVAQGDLTLKQLLETAPTDAGIYGEHLRRHLWTLEQNPDLAKAFQQVVNSELPIKLPTLLAFKLNGMGLVSMRVNEVVIRHEHLYRPYFLANLKVRT